MIGSILRGALLGLAIAVAFILAYDTARHGGTPVTVDAVRAWWTLSADEMRELIDLTPDIRGYSNGSATWSTLRLRWEEDSHPWRVGPRAMYPLERARRAAKKRDRRGDTRTVRDDDGLYVSTHWGPWRPYTPVGDECCPDCHPGSQATAYRKTKRGIRQPASKKERVGFASSGGMCACVPDYEECLERQRARSTPLPADDGRRI